MFALFEDRFAEPGEPAAWLFEGLVERIQGDWSEIQAAILRAQEKGFWAVVALNYELGYEFEPVAGAQCSDACRIWIFAERTLLNPPNLAKFLKDQQDQLPPSARMAGTGGLIASWSETTHAAAVHKIQDYIRAGDCYQVNLTFPLHFSFFGHPLALYLALRECQQTRFGGLILDTESPVLSLSPELFLEKTGGVLKTRPMKGTAARECDPVSDRLAADRLEQSVKNRAENLMIVDLLRNDLSRLRAANGHAPYVRVPELFAIEPYPTVWQMVSQVEGHFSEAEGATITPSQLLQALFPCGSITGAPKVRAMQIVDELEPVARGLYTGSLGWFAPNGDCRLNVAIRTLELRCNGAMSGRGSMGVGGGIVQDSVAKEEWSECWLKARFLTQLDPQIRLIETLRLENGFPLLEAHLARLTRSADWLGFKFDVAELRDRLQLLAGQYASQNPDQAQRVRVTLGHRGDVDIQAFLLVPEPVGSRYVRMAEATIESQHPLQGHKTTWRQHYDQALSEISATPEVFDVLFFNESGELVEGARSSVFVFQGGIWKTPPLSSGVLPGIWRNQALQGRVPGIVNAVEATLYREDLTSAERIICGNALRGAVEVNL